MMCFMYRPFSNTSKSTRLFLEGLKTTSYRTLVESQGNEWARSVENNTSWFVEDIYRDGGIIAEQRPSPTVQKAEGTIKMTSNSVPDTLHRGLEWPDSQSPTISTSSHSVPVNLFPSGLFQVNHPTGLPTVPDWSCLYVAPLHWDPFRHLRHERNLVVFCKFSRLFKTSFFRPIETNWALKYLSPGRVWFSLP